MPIMCRVSSGQRLNTSEQTLRTEGKGWVLWKLMGGAQNPALGQGVSLQAGSAESWREKQGLAQLEAGVRWGRRRGGCG